MNRQTRLLSLLLLGLLAGCASGAGCDGCAGMQPIPGGRFVGQKVDNGMAARVSASGVAVLNANWQTLLAQFAPGSTMVVPMPCTVKPVTLLGNFAIADQGELFCASESCGQMDGKCDAKDVPAEILITFHGLSFAPKAPDLLEATLEVTLHTGKLLVDSVSRNHATCLLTNPLKCGIDFDTARAPPTRNAFRAGIRLVINQRWDKLLSFEVASIDGSSSCGSGTPTTQCIDPSDIIISTEGPCQTCTAGQFDAVKSLLIDQVVASLKSSIQDALDDQTCQACSAVDPTCPQLAPAASSCKVDLDGGQDSGVCIDTATGRCVPGILGMEGRMQAAALLPGLNAPEESLLDLSMAAGSSASCDTGINVGMRTGAKEVVVADCVKPLSAPPPVLLSPPTFDGEAPDGGYDLGLSVSRQFMDHALLHTQQSGAMCIAISTAQVPQLSSGVFKPILPSLGRLTSKEEDVPMMVVLRPGAAPTITVGEGTYDPVTHQPIDPLLTIKMKDLGVDFYALVEDRQVRLFTLTSDLSFPLSLIFEGCTDVTPALGSLTGAITNVRASNSEIVAEDLSALESLIPMFIGLAEPQLSAGLKAFTLPALGAFKLQVASAKGLTPTGAGSYEHLGLYASLLRATDSCTLSAPSTHALLERSVMPLPEAMRARGQVLPWPVAVLRVSTSGAVGSAQFSTRINGGLWSPFTPSALDGTMEVTHPAFLLQGAHRIEVRSRLAEHPRAVSAPVEVGFVVDFAPPELSLKPDPAHDRLQVWARDSVSARPALRFAYKLGEGDWTGFGPAREVALQAVEQAGGITVRVQDEASLTAQAAYRVPRVALRQEPEPTPGEASAGGCSSAAGLGAWGALLLAWALRRSRS